MNYSELIFNFSDPVDFLNYALGLKQLNNRRFSLRAWARQLGFINPSFLSHILKNERKLNLDLAAKITDNLKLKSDAKRYFEYLILFKYSKTMDEKSIYSEMIESIKPEKIKSQQTLSIEEFRIISDWYHTAILEMVELKDFKYDLEYISQRLGGEYSIQEVKKAVERLLDLELLKEIPSGKIKRNKGNSILLENNIPNIAVRHYHKQLLEKAKVAIDSQTINERDIRGTTISIKKKDYNKITEIIKKAHSEILKYSTEGEGEEIYHLSSQFFRLTQKKEDL